MTDETQRGPVNSVTDFQNRNSWIYTTTTTTTPSIPTNQRLMETSERQSFEVISQSKKRSNQEKITELSFRTLNTETSESKKVQETGGKNLITLEKQNPETQEGRGRKSRSEKPNSGQEEKLKQHSGKTERSGEKRRERTPEPRDGIAERNAPGEKMQKWVVESIHINLHPQEFMKTYHLRNEVEGVTLWMFHKRINIQQWFAVWLVDDSETVLWLAHCLELEMDSHIRHYQFIEKEQDIGIHPKAKYPNPDFTIPRKWVDLPNTIYYDEDILDKVIQIRKDAFIYVWETKNTILQIYQPSVFKQCGAILGTTLLQLDPDSKAYEPQAKGIMCFRERQKELTKRITLEDQIIVFRLKSIYTDDYYKTTLRLGRR